MTDIDAARLPLMLTSLRLPTIGRYWEEFAARSDKEGWGAARFLAALCEYELADRSQRRIARHLQEPGLPRGKTFATFDLTALPTLRKAHVLALAEGDADHCRDRSAGSSRNHSRVRHRELSPAHRYRRAPSRHERVIVVGDAICRL
jgi:DNA replication protein DnaC